MVLDFLYKTVIDQHTRWPHGQGIVCMDKAQKAIVGPGFLSMRSLSSPCQPEFCPLELTQEAQLQIPETL